MNDLNIFYSDVGCWFGLSPNKNEKYNESIGKLKV